MTPININKRNGQSDPRWVEARAELAGQAEARSLAREIKKAGALRLWQQGPEVRSLWPHGPETRDALADLEQRHPGRWRQRSFTAAKPESVWLDPRPEAICPGLCLAPAWLGLPAGPEILVIDALTAFGAGDHPSTRLNLELLARRLADSPPPAHAWLADVGCGTGILALGMALLAQMPVAAVDPEPAALRATRRNMALNPLAAPWVHLARGTHASLRGPFALAAANLPGPILLMAAQRLAAMLAPGGAVVVSGFREEAAGEIAQRMQGLGLVQRDQAASRGWSAACWQHPAK